MEFVEGAHHRVFSTPYSTVVNVWTADNGLNHRINVLWFAASMNNWLMEMNVSAKIDLWEFKVFVEFAQKTAII